MPISACERFLQFYRWTLQSVDSVTCDHRPQVETPNDVLVEVDCAFIQMSSAVGGVNTAKNLLGATSYVLLE